MEEDTKKTAVEAEEVATVVSPTPTTNVEEEASTPVVSTTTTTTTTSSAAKEEKEEAVAVAAVVVPIVQTPQDGEEKITNGSKKVKKTEEEKLAKKLAKEHGRGSAVAMKKVDEAVANWSGVYLAPFPGIPMHDSKEKIIEDKLSEWIGGEETAPAQETFTPRKPTSLMGGLPIIGSRSDGPKESKVRPLSINIGAKPSPAAVDKGQKEDIKTRHGEIETAVADWVGVPTEIFKDPKNPQSSAAAFPGIRLHVIKNEAKEEKEVVKEIEERVAAWAGTTGTAGDS